MAVDQGDLPRKTETLSPHKPRLLFHVSNIGSEAFEPMKKFGLLSSSPTLTPRLDVGFYYSGGQYITFWYPQKGEVDRGIGHDAQTPTLPVTEDMRAEMLKTVDDMDIQDFFKRAQRRVIEKANTYLPGNRLRAIADTKSIHDPFAFILPEDPGDFIKRYTIDREKMTSKIREALDRMKIEFIDPTLNKDILTDDIIRTSVEHHLSAIGEHPGWNQRELESNLKALEGGIYDDPVWDRYRRVLINRIKGKLEQFKKEIS